LPRIRGWLEQLGESRDELAKCERRLENLRKPGRDLGGDLVNRWIRTLGAIQSVLLEFHRREIQLKDLERGLVDFPALIGGKEVFLCWEKDEDDVEFWHDLETGYAGRERLPGAD
jgi:hypothetical protein